MQFSGDDRPIVITTRSGAERHCWLELAEPEVSTWRCLAGDVETHITIPQRLYERSVDAEQDELKQALRLALSGRMICTTCHGAGEVTSGGPRMSYTGTCERCMGSGWEPVENDALLRSAYTRG